MLAPAANAPTQQRRRDGHAARVRRALRGLQTRMFWRLSGCSGASPNVPAPLRMSWRLSECAGASLPAPSRSTALTSLPPCRGGPREQRGSTARSRGNAPTPSPTPRDTRVASERAPRVASISARESRASARGGVAHAPRAASMSARESRASARGGVAHAPRVASMSTQPSRSAVTRASGKPARR